MNGTQNRRQKATARLLAGFFIMMLFFTLLSRTASGMTIAVVRTETTGAGILTHRYSLPGTVEARRTADIILPEGLRISGALVQSGDRVEAGDGLLQMDQERTFRVRTKLEEEIRVLDTRLEGLALPSAGADMQSVEQAERNLKYAQEDYVRLATGWQLAELRSAQDQKEAQEEYDQALQGLAEEENRIRKEQVGSAQDSRREAERALGTAQYDRSEAVAAAQNALDDARRDREEAQTAWENAEGRLQDAKAGLKEAQEVLSALGEDADEAEREAAQSAVEAAMEKRDAAQKEAEDTAEKLSLSEESLERAQEELDRITGRQNQLVAEAEEDLQKSSEALSQAQEKTDWSRELQGSAAWSQMDQAQDGLKETARSREDDAWTKQDQLLAAQREIETAKAELAVAKEQAERERLEKEAAQKQEEADRLQYESERREKQELLEQIEALNLENGILSAPFAATVRKVSEAGNTQDGVAAVVLTQDGQGFLLTAETDAETAQQLSSGDTGAFTFTLGGETQTVEVKIESVGRPDENGMVRIRAEMEEGEYEDGISGTLELAKSSERYQTVVPLSALRSSDGRTTVLAVREKQTVLGTEQTVEEVDVTVKDRDTENAAIEAALFPDDQIVVHTSKPIEKGDRVRVEN